MLALDDVSGSEKLKLVRELGVIRKNIPIVSGVNKLVLAKRVREIRTLMGIGGTANGDQGLSVSVGDKVGSLKAMSEYLESGMQGIHDYLKVSEAKALKEIWRLVSAYKGDDQDADLDDVNAFHNSLPRYGDDDYKVSLLGYFSEIGGVFSYDADAINATAELVRQAQNDLRIPSPENEKEVRDIRSKIEDLRKSASAMLEINQYNGYDIESIDKAADEYANIREKIKSAYARIEELHTKDYEKKRADMNSLKDSILPIGKGIIDTLTNNSKVSVEQAEKWANSQEIDKSVVARLKKQGYPEADIRRDMAEFYRITGGKLRDIGIKSTGARRAHAGSIAHFEGNYITPGSGFDKCTLWHELAHHLESDPVAKDAANGYLLKRRESKQVYSLRSLSGNSGYRSDEGAYKDTFINPYIGKVYNDESTEVFSMGLQYLSDPYSAAMMAAKDPEMLGLMAGYISSELTPAVKALKSIRDGAKGINEEYRNNAESEYQDAINSLADGIEITSDAWFEQLSQYAKESLIRYGFGSKSDAKYVGRVGQNIHVFSGKFRIGRSRRLQKGYAMFDESAGGNFDESKGVIRIPAIGYFQNDESIVRAAIRIAINDFGGDVYRVSWNVFGGKSVNIFEIINRAKKILGKPSE